jgi:hypothetical protein
VEEKMKKAVVFIVVIALLSNCAHNLHHYHNYKKTRPIVISTRVGETIDFEERKQFDLFRGIEEFKAATFYDIEDGGYEVEILTDHEKLIAVNRDSYAVEISRDYIDNYNEFGKSRESFEKKWKIVAYDDLGFPITSYEVSSVKNQSLAWACGGGCMLLGALPVAFLGMLAGGATPAGGDFDWPKGLVAIISGTAAFVALGVVIGNEISNRKALKEIKEARKPRVVD